MSELIQESKYITVQEFMPKWTALKEKIGDNHILSCDEAEAGVRYIDATMCLIGEAHQFDKDRHYGGCKICNDFSYAEDMYSSLSRATVAKNGTVREFYQFKEDVYNHFMQAHPEKLLRK